MSENKNKALVDRLRELVFGAEEEAKEKEKSAEKTFAEYTTDKDTVLVAESLEVGAPVFVVADGEQVPAPDGEYMIPEEGVTVVVAEGVVTDIIEAQAEEEAPAAEEEMSAEKYVTKEHLEKVLEGLVGKFSEVVEDKFGEVSKGLEAAKEEFAEVTKVKRMTGKPAPEKKVETKEGFSLGHKNENSLANRLLKKGL